VGETYAQNAQLKAEAAVAAGGEPALGDDSGLEVDALGGLPGLRSARLAPTPSERIAAVLARLEGAPRPWTARFVCVTALAVPGRATQIFTGECRGQLVEPRSAGRGFGYDPIFLVPEVGLTFAEMEPSEKHVWSHRAAAVRALLAAGVLGTISGGGA
jgi:XTP/dITP diphosphohydrolase